ncbi:beta-glucosidase family protein [Allonocardiopsis opalescens]|uniref:Beta-glucosidase n=1 Tax=Allonocardiopsis opalescens TaxID=1144618 RepID=A0A2T0QAM7_9ACTN|nr:glycoside hydrolase family 3 N-terminal domain-containing protein [Allonocardiopsis opalescens]PRY00897.1 beta-glucosidase [Allonocardiopsis opalescens]
MTDAPERADTPMGTMAGGPWQDPSLPTAQRVADLMSRMTLREKVQQLIGFWAAPAAEGETVAPMQDSFSADVPSLDLVSADGLGHLTRVFGTAPVRPAEGIVRLAALQRDIAAANRFGIPAIAHEECLTGLAAHAATVFPTPLAWGATFDPELVEEMSSAIAASMRALGVHQGLAPVLDVTRDYRWGRTEETIGEDPQLVGVLGSAYVRGLERGGIVATLKHFAGYSTSRAGRNHAPAALGPRELNDVIVEPFVMALRTGGARSVMNSYADLDGVPAAADERLLTDRLRGELGFTGVLVSDYYAISFLETTHGVAGSPGEAAALALRAGIDVELPTVRCYGEPLLEMVYSGAVPEELVDRSVHRVLTQKCELGLLDADWAERLDLLAEAAASAEAPIDLDSPASRAVARRLAERSVVLAANDGVLPLSAELRRVAVVGPLGDDPLGMLGCYTFPIHVGRRHPEMPMGVEIPGLAERLAAELPGAELRVEFGCPVIEAPESTDREEVDRGIAAAVAAAREAEVCVLAVGDRAGMFGRGTSGEGCDAESLELPGRQRELAEAVLATGTPTVLVLLSGRPYALGGLAERAAAVVAAFFPGEEGAAAIAGVLTGRVEPSGRLPVSIPRTPGSQPATYLHAPLAGRSDVSSVDPTPLYPFGHGLGWTSFAFTDLALETASGAGVREPGESGVAVPTDGSVVVSCTVTNTGGRAGGELVQLYLSDPVASVVRPVRWLAGWTRVHLEPGASARVRFTVHADRTSFTDPRLRRVVEPGRIDVALGRSSGELPLTGSFRLRGPVREPGPDRVLDVPVEVVAG